MVCYNHLEVLKMKKLLAVLLALSLVFVFVFAGCGDADNGTESSSPTSSKPVIDDDDDEDKEPLVLSDGYEYFARTLKSRDFKIEKPEDLSNYKLGYINGTDSEKIAKYYEGSKGSAGYNGPNDAYSGLALDVDIIIVDRMAAEDEHYADRITLYGPFESAN